MSDKFTVEKKLIEAIRKFQDGDETAFQAVYDNSIRYINYSIHMSLKDADLLDDILQETYLEVYKNLKSLREPEAFKKWAVVIAHNKISRYYRVNKDSVFSSEEEMDAVIENEEEKKEDMLPEDALDNQETQRLILDIINGLPDLQRQTIIAFYYNQMSVSEIAEALGVPENTTKTNLSRGRKKIKDGVLELEKKHGTKLYTLPIMAVLSGLFAKEAMACVLPANGLALIESESDGSAASDAAGKEIAKATTTATAKASVVKWLLLAVAGVIVFGISAVAVFSINSQKKTGSAVVEESSENITNMKENFSETNSSKPDSTTENESDLENGSRETDNEKSLAKANDKPIEEETIPLSEDSWKAEYLKYLEDNASNESEDKYGLVYINDDNIPEMAIRINEQGECYLTCGTDDCDVLKIESQDYSSNVYFHEKRNDLMVLTHNYDTESVSFDIYKIEDGKWVQISSENNEPDENDFSVKGSCRFFGGSSYEQMRSFLSGNGPSDYKTAFRDLYDTGAFTNFSGKNYDKFSLYDLGNDGTMELVGISDETSFGSYAIKIASYKDGLVGITDAGISDEMTDSTIFDIDLSTISQSSTFSRFTSYSFETVKNCTLLINYSMEGDLTSSAPADDDDGWSYDPERDGEYMYTVNGIRKTESYVAEIIKEWKKSQSSNRKYITFWGSYTELDPDPCEPMEFHDFDSLIP